jgi:hypothetical protein
MRAPSETATVPRRTLLVGCGMLGTRLGLRLPSFEQGYEALLGR